MIQALILATRDAIARQVREEARKHPLWNDDEFTRALRHFATFIEGLTL